MPETPILCGGADSARVSAGNSLKLDIEAPKGDAAKVNLHIEHLTKTMVANVPDRLADLLEIACYVFCADQFVSRGGNQMRKMGADWRRSFRFSIPVREPDFWRQKDVIDCLRDTLSFLSEDDYAFEFSKTNRHSGLEPYLDYGADGPPGGFEPDNIVLFSGGLDSLTGAAESLLAKSRRVALVSHRSSPMVQSKQSELIHALRARARPKQLFAVGIAVNKGHEEAREFTQRSRSFLFAALGLVAARLFHKDELTFFENGIVSLNLPVSEHVLGSRVTRTTHPKVLAGFSRLFSVVTERTFDVINPYFWKTKADVVRALADLGCAELIAATFSCTRVRQATREGHHCGLCSQCIDRRFAVLAEALGKEEPDGFYGVDLFYGAREPGPDLTFAESYILTAAKWASMSELAFLGHYGQVYRVLPYLHGGPQESAARLHQLHVRHGGQIDGVVAEALKSHAGAHSILNLPRQSLLAMIQSVTARPFVDVAEVEPPASQQVSNIKANRFERPIRFAIEEDTKCVVFPGGITLKGPTFRLIAQLARKFFEDQKANLAADAYRYTSIDTLAKMLCIEPQTVRQHISRARRSFKRQFIDVFDAVPADDDVIENNKWDGYRLNPYLAPTPAALIVEAD